MNAARARAPQALDLALIGNSTAAALVDPVGACLVVLPLIYESDPVFSRLLAGDEEKGFCDIVLDRSGEMRIAAICATPRSSKRS